MNRTRVTDWLVRTQRVLLAVAIITTFGCFGGNVEGCFGGSTDNEGPQFVSGILLGDETLFSDPIQARGETFTIPVSIRRTGSQDFNTTTVTPTPIPGVTFEPATRELDVPENGFTTVTFEATVGASATLGQHELRFTRTGPSDRASLLTTSTSLTISDKLASATITPITANLHAGSTRTYEVAVLPRGDSEGTVNLTVALNGTDLTYSPHNFSVNLVKNSTTPIRETITVSADTTATSRTTSLRIRQDARDLCAADVVVIGSTGGDPTFAITANPLTVSAPNGGTSTESVLFTVRSVNGFNGRVKITWNVDGSIRPVPEDNNFEGDVTPTTPFTFTRRFARNATHDVPLPIVINATDIPFTETKGVTITVTTPP